MPLAVQHSFPQGVTLLCRANADPNMLVPTDYASPGMGRDVGEGAATDLTRSGPLDGRHPLLCEAVRFASVEVVRRLLECGADFSAVTELAGGLHSALQSRREQGREMSEVIPPRLPREACVPSDWGGVGYGWIGWSRMRWDVVGTGGDGWDRNGWDGNG